LENKDKGIGLWVRHKATEILLLALALLIGQPAWVAAQSQEKRRVAVLPFRVYAVEPLDHLQKGLQEMFSARLADYGLSAIDPAVVNKHPMALLPAFERENILAIGRDLNADVVVTGSLTQVGHRISLDLKAYDIPTAKPPFSIYMVEDDIDKLADAVDKASKSLYNQITGVEQIDSLRVEGNQRVESEAILAVVDSKKGESLDYDKLDKDLRAIYRMGFFKDVSIETEDGPKGKVVIFKVQEKPSIGKISFSGNKKEKDDDLLKESGMKLYTILNRSEVRQSVNRLEEYYRQKGYYNIEIKERIEDLPRNEVALIYQIDEGKKIYIEKIEFVGNTKFDDGDLKDVMGTSERGLFSWFTKSGLLDRKKLEFDLQKVTAYYHNHGYIRAKTGEPKISYEKDKGLTITIEVIEGDPFRVNQVKLEGDLIQPEEKLLKKVKIKDEKFFNREVVRQDTLALREIYADEGFAYADVSPLVKEDDENKTVDITYKISKGKKVRFERINITGNTQTRDKVIRRELEVVEGEYYSGEGIRKSTANLYRVGYFDDVELQTKKGSEDDLMVLNVNVKERATGMFSIGAGYSSFDDVFGVFEVSQRNLFGRGQKLKGAVRVGSKTQEYDIRFVEPWFLGRELALGIDLYNWAIEYTEYTKDSLGGALRLGFPLGLDDYTKGNVKYTYDDADISDIHEAAATAIKEMEGRNVTSSVKLGIERDSRDRLWNTTKGSTNEVSFEYAGGPLGGDVAFNRYQVETAWYLPLWWNTVFMAKGRWGYMEARPEDGKLPIYQKYRIGGLNTVRGYEYGDISPRDPETGDRIGGEKMMIYNFEFRFPLIKEQGVAGVLFFDAGNVWGEQDDYDFGDLKMSVGTGIRWYSPVGPVRLEYGYVIDPGPDEPSGNWEFGIGGFF
jgi:outer membrane protein insertion porin family